MSNPYAYTSRATQRIYTGSKCFHPIHHHCHHGMFGWCISAQRTSFATLESRTSYKSGTVTKTRSRAITGPGGPFMVVNNLRRTTVYNSSQRKETCEATKQINFFSMLVQTRESLNVYVIDSGLFAIAFATSLHIKCTAFLVILNHVMTAWDAHCSTRHS